MSKNYSVIVAAARTPFAKASREKGALAKTHPVDMLVAPVNAVLDRTGIDPMLIDKVIIGCVHQEGPQDMNVGRLLALHSQCKLKNVTVGSTVNDFCASSLLSIANAHYEVVVNPDTIIMAGGVETMSQIPFSGFNPLLNEHVYHGNVAGFMNMGFTAEVLAKEFGISREMQDAYALESHRRANEAQHAGRFDKEIVPFNGLNQDNGIRVSSLEALAALPTPFLGEGGTVTAGTSSQITDGAGVMLIMSEKNAAELDLPVLARILGAAEHGVEPERMGIGPVGAIRKVFNRLGISEAGLFEINEAFAAQVLAVQKGLRDIGIDAGPDKLNLDGGAIALGHALGATGERITGHLAYAMRDRDVEFGVSAACAAGGMGMAIVLQNPEFAPNL